MEVTKKYKPRIVTSPSPEALANKALEMFVAEAKSAIDSKGHFNVAISGGHTPKLFFERLADSPESLSLHWDLIHLFWVDEKCVGPDSESSNYKLAATSFLPKVPIPSENVHRIPGECCDCREAARDYEKTIRKVFALKTNDLPVFDLIVLGMGADGHIGSLFPNSYGPFDMEEVVCVVYFLDDKLNRVTLTHPVLCASRHLMILVSGQEKAETLKEVLHGEPDLIRFPVHVLWPILDKVTWLVDKEAAKYL